MARKWTREDAVKLCELLVESNSTVMSHPKFREQLDRDENLFTNQVIREANGNIAYRSVDCDILNMSDEDFWNFVDGAKYSELIEDNAAVAILKMAEKLNLIH
jgi:hypothetical protein